MCDGVGGQAGAWTGTPKALSPFLIDWKVEYLSNNIYVNETACTANQCLRMGRYRIVCKTSTPKLGFIGDGKLSFKVASYNNKPVVVSLEIEGGGSLSQSTITTPLNSYSALGYQEFTMDIKNATPESRVIFLSGSATTDGRFYLDNVKVTAPKVGYAALDNKIWTADKGATSLDISGLQPYNSYKYIIKALGSGELTGINRHNSAYTDTMEVKTNLQSLFSQGVDGEPYVLNIPLYGVWADDVNGIIYVKTQSNFCTFFSHPGEGDRDSYEDNIDNFDQRDWIGLKIDQPHGYVNKMFKAGISGIFDGSKLNPTLKDVTLNGVVSYTDDAILNQYAPCNFNQPLAQNDYKPFWVMPQINEIAQVVGMIKYIDGTYYLCDHNNEMVEIDNSLNYIKDESTNYIKFEVLIGKKSSENSRSILSENEKYLIKAISEAKIATGIESNIDKAPSAISLYGHTLYFNTQQEWMARIYDFSGSIIKEIAVSNGSSIILEKGLYIVDFNSQRIKAMVK